MIGPVALVLSAVGALTAFLLVTPGLDGEKVALSLGDDGVLRSLAGAGSISVLSPCWAWPWAC